MPRTSPRSHGNELDVNRRLQIPTFVQFVLAIGAQRDSPLSARVPAFSVGILVLAER
jgi:hypothetical protein